MGNLEANAVLKDRYQIKSVLGRNALGVTYEGADTGSGSHVVIRELFPEGLCCRTQDSAEVTGSEAFAGKKEQFLRQMRILAGNTGLEGIADVYDVFEEHGTAYCVIEYVEGISLEKYLSQSGKQFPIKRIKELTLPIVKSLSALHDAGVLHQNISPDNLIFTNKGNLKLIGFGCMEGQISEEGKGYVPVELYRRQQECGPAADVYSLCASIYRCITGVVPQDAYERLNNDQLKKPSQLGIEIDAGDEAGLMMGLNIYEEKRFRTMTALQNAFYRSQKPPVNPPIKAVSQPVPPAGAVSQPIPQPVPPAEPVPPAGMIIQTHSNSDAAPKQKKSGNGGMIAIAAVGGILIVGLGISAFLLGKDMFPKTSKVDKGTKAVAEQETEEDSTEEGQQEEKPNVGSEYEDMLAAGNFTGALDGILALDTTDMTAEEKDILSDILSRAVTGQYTEFENRLNEKQNAGDFDSAFAAVDEELALYDRLSANSMAAQYVNRQQVEDKRNGIKQSHMDYLLGTKLEDAVRQGNEEEFDSLMTSVQAYVNEGMMSQEEFDTKKTSACARFVLEKIAAMNNAGAAAAEIVTYINDHLYDTGNNCNVLEYWDYYRAVMGQGAGDPATVRSASNSGYLLPDSSTRNLTTGDISGLSKDALRLAIYEIFARHGKIFQDQAVSKYFSAFSWYQPSAAYDESTLNTFEKFNLNLLIEYQKSKGYR